MLNILVHALYPLHVHAAFPRCISVPHGYAVYPCCMFMMHFHTTCPCCMSMMYVRVAYPRCVSLLYVQAHVNAGFPCYMSLQLVHAVLSVCDACPCQFCMSWPSCVSLKSNLHVHAASLYCMSILHVPAASPCRSSMVHVRVALSCCLTVLHVPAAC